MARLIDADKLHDLFDKNCVGDCNVCNFYTSVHYVIHNKDCKGHSYCGLIDNAPTVEERPQGEWIPIKTRPLTEEEKEEYPDYSFMYDCQMPEDGQQILISTKYGVEFDTCFADDGYYLDSDRDWEDVYAWQPLPKPYKEADND